MSLDSFVAMVKKEEDKDGADALRFAALDDNECQLCHAHGEDKRSLFIRCFYDVSEVVPEAIRLRAVPDESLRHHGFYLRICKCCRGDLLGSLGAWRNRRVALRDTPKDSDGHPEERWDDPERNIPVRVNGAIEMLTRAEWDEREARRK